MSLLQGTLHSGDPATHNGSNSSDEVTRHPARLRESQSHANLLSPLTPLIRLIRDPATSLEGLLDRVWIGEEPSEDERKAEVDRRKQLLNGRMTDATSYSTWRAAAIELDSLEGNDSWKLEPESPYYDHKLLQLRLDQLNETQRLGDTSRMLFLLRTSLTRSLGNMGDLNLYKDSHIGTKALIEDYISTACTALDALETATDSTMEPRLVLDQLLATRQAFGRSALLLSGGGTFGMNHSGVVKCLWESHLLPRIVSGSSAGAIVSAVICTRTDAEVPATLAEFCYGDLDVFEKTGEEESLLRKAARFAKFGSVFDIQHLVRVMSGLIGDLTFQEAYNRTRRILNISVSSASVHELPRLLNYITAPNVIIWSAVAASCSVPLIFSPASIFAKDPKTGAVVPWNTSPQRWIDGSVDNDLPMTRLAEMFNVNHFIVSQVNPHVVPFLTSEEYVSRSGSGGQDDTAVAAGSGWLHTMASFAKTEAMHRMHVLAELGVFPNYFTKIRSVLSQKYSGDITILPEVSFAQFPLVLQNPTAEFMVAAMMAGERATWPKLSRIQNHCAIELALDRAVQKLRARMVFSPSQVDLRMMSLRPLQRKIAHFGEGSGAGRVPLKRSITSSGPQFVDKRTARPKFELRPSKRSNQKLNRSSSQVGTNSGIQYSSDSDSEAEDPDASYINLTLPRKRKGRQPDSDSDDSVPFNPRSYSPSPEPGSSNVHLAPAPKMWPSPQHIFPSKSQPAIPSQMSPRTREFAHSSTINLPGRWPSSHAMDSATAQLTMTPLIPNVSGRRNHADSSTSTAGSTSGTRRSAISRRKSSRSLG